MKRFVPSLILAILLVSASAMAQGNRPNLTGTIKGKILDSEFQVPLEYSNIVLYSHRDSSMVSGTVTNKDGYFELTNVPPGTYDLEILFLGYERETRESIRLNRSNREVDLGKIYLRQTVLSVDAVQVEGERVPISYQIDKKVINVDQQYSTLSGSAVDVLENVPSVTVDIEGNVSLRGSGSFRVLIDGRPSVLEPSEALEQIPASTIENIEIITNPSAKFDPEGTAGIINVILKKTQKTGQSGLINLNAGLNEKYGGDLLYEMKRGDYNTILGVDYNNRTYTGSSLEENITTRNGISSYIYSEGNSTRGRISMGLRGNLDIRLSPKDNLSFSGRYGDRTSQRDSELDYTQWADNNPTRLSYFSITERERSGEFYQINSSFIHRFAGKGHQLYAEATYENDHSDEKTINELISNEGLITNGQRFIESGPGSEARIKLDYTNPFSEKNKFEAGWQSEFDKSEENTDYQEYDESAGAYISLPKYSNSTVYKRNVHATYALYSGEWKKFGYQGGLRAEYTDRAVEFSGVEDRFTIDRWDLFPSIHTSYQFAGGHQMMVSYTRRIERPRGWELEPFMTWMDAYNVRVGNPDLKPEYINSYEAGFQTYFGKSLFSTEIYYRETINKIERIRSVYSDNVTLRSVDNIGKDYALGSELLLNIDAARFWNINILGNLYDYRVEGMLLGESFSRESFNWGGRISNNIKIGQSLQFQIDGHYRSPTVSAQGEREGFFMANAAVKYEFLPNQLSATLQVRDVLGTGKFEHTSSGPEFYNYGQYTRESPLVMLNIRFNINNYKQKDRQRVREENGVNVMEDDF
ncbi:MAG: TonB-dependent receptor [Calditrichaeota bacterium]|nr:TonB-dependent receptor [Calditrichota bacterium]RQW02735.1 MAG: TonB-dependent receptor [Calditrichota bacterium]